MAAGEREAGASGRDGAWTSRGEGAAQAAEGRSLGSVVRRGSRAARSYRSWLSRPACRLFSGAVVHQGRAGPESGRGEVDLQPDV